MIDWSAMSNGLAMPWLPIARPPTPVNVIVPSSRRNAPISAPPSASPDSSAATSASLSGRVVGVSGREAGAVMAP